MSVLDGARSGLIVVAHPDDESLWFAGLPLRYPEIKWEVVCCTIPRRDGEKVRAWKFFEACRRLGATARLLPFVEPDPKRTDIRGLELLDFTADVVATHNPSGEYGHAQHRVLNEYVRSAWSGPTLWPGYGMEDGALVVALTDQERVQKLSALMAYDYESTYRGKRDAKGMNLIRHYHNDEGFDLWRETYHVA